MKAVRHESLLALVQARGHASIQDVGDALGVSAATVRRDILELEERGRLERTWGGVRLAASEDDPFQYALQQSGGGKQRIARAAAESIPDGATVVLDIGTTVYYVAMAIVERELTVITASLPIFEHLRQHPNIRLALLGGSWSEQYQCFDGPQVVEALGSYQADLAFLGCSGVGDTGKIRDTSQSQASIKRAIMKAATHTSLLADSSKFPGKGACAASSLGEINGVYTDLPALNEPLADLCRTHSTEVTLV